MADENALTARLDAPIRAPGPAAPSPAASDSNQTADADAARPVVPGYELVRVIGRGGMGIVWEAIEHRFDRRVALKVHTETISQRVVTQVWSEARLAAKVADPGVVAVHDLGTTLDGRAFYTMDLVEGTDLRSLLCEGAVPLASAMTIARQIAHAVAAAHDRGIVHRDLKPANVLIDAQGRARILDFGLAVSTLAHDLFEDTVVGTPAYMSPEQAAGEPAGAAADIHAVGIIVYEMLTGERLFAGRTMAETLDAVRSKRPEPLGPRNAAVHPDLDRLVLQCLEKRPTARFSSARKLANAFDALFEGRPVAPLLGDSSVPTRAMPDAGQTAARMAARDAAPVHLRWAWKLAASPAQLWPFVADTDRLNKAIGLPAVEFLEADEEGVPVRKARTRILGMEVAWRELPFDWVKDHVHSVYREYDRGPVAAMWNRVELEPLPGGGTELVHELWLVPRHFVGKVAVRWQATYATRKNLDRVYRRIDALVAGGDPAAREQQEDNQGDVFEGTHKPTHDQKRAVETGAAKLAQRGLDRAVVDRLGDHLLFQPTKLLERMRPYALARMWGMDRKATLTMFLHAANAGLVELAWDLRCPRCLAAHESVSALSQVGRVGECAACGASYSRDLRDSVELVFRPRDDVRTTVPATYCAGGPALRPHVLVQQVLGPGERRDVVVELERGNYQVAAANIAQSFAFTASAAGFVSQAEVAIDSDIAARPGVVRAGRVTFALANVSDKTRVVRVETGEGRGDGVAAADVLSLTEFRDLFSQQLLAEGEHISVSRMAFLVVDVADRADLLMQLGDAGAWMVAHKLGTLLEAQLRAHGGVAVPSSVDLFLAAFSTSKAAVRRGRRSSWQRPIWVEPCERRSTKGSASRSREPAEPSSSARPSTARPSSWPMRRRRGWRCRLRSRASTQWPKWCRTWRPARSSARPAPALTRVRGCCG
jgi:tRNA A-37 threonylcarbamoyl transferase component Bud32